MTANSTRSKRSPKRSSPTLENATDAAEWLARRETLIAIEREICRRSFAEFVKRAWHVVEPDRAYTHNWHIDCICEHLEAVSRGEINRLKINIPPGMMKSLLVSVFWQAWEWGPLGRASTRFLSTAFNDTPVTRDTRKTRDLIMSRWYQERWGDAVRLVRVAETSFANDRTGTREGVAFGSLTSQRGDRLLIDDPHSTETAESDADRERTTRRFREGAQNRLNDIRESAMVVIMQRLHEQDVSGVIEELGLPFVSVCLPMEYEADRACKTRWFTDPRKEEGELLFPALFPPPEMKTLRAAIGEYAWAGQYQQRPAPRKGGIFDVDAIEIVDALPRVTSWCRAWDLAGTEGAGAFTAGALLGRLADSKGYIIADMRRAQLKPSDAQALIKETAEHDRATYRPAPRIRVPKDPGQAGVAQRDDYAQLLDGHPVEFVAPTGDKVLRALPFATQVETRRVLMLRGEWNDALKAEMRGFPAFRYKDQIDALSDAYADLLANPDPLDLGIHTAGSRDAPFGRIGH